MRKTLAAFLTNFGKFDTVEIDAIVESIQIESFKKGTIILSEGETCEKCYFVLKGCLRQYKLVDGEEKTTGFSIEGQTAVLYSSYLAQTPSQYNLSCLEDSVLITGDRAQEQALISKHPKLEFLVHLLMPQDYARIEDRLALLHNHRPAERYRVLIETQPELLNRVPLHYLASFIGVTPESFSRIRKRFLLKQKQQRN